MQMHINGAKVIDPRSDLHGKLVDIETTKGKHTVSVSKSKGSSITVDGKEVWAGKDLYISTGWVDAFADYREPGYEHKETITTGLNAAAAGGFTDVLLAPNANPTLSTKAMIRFVLQKAEGHSVSLHPMGAATQNIDGKDLAEMLDMHQSGAIIFTDGWKPIQNAGLMQKALEYVKAFDGAIVQIPVDSTLSAGGLMHEGEVSTSLGMAGIPALAETLMVHRDIELAKYTDSKLHISGISTAESADMIRKAKAQGVKVTCSVTPYHLALTDESLRNYSSLYKVSPPLRTEADRKALVAALKDGTIDCIATHHRPHEWDAKAKEFEYAGEGMNVQEIAFNIIWEAVKKEITIDRLIEAMSTEPAEIFGIQQHGIDANLQTATIFTTDGSHTLSATNKKSLGMNNPFMGKPLSGQVLGIINNGNIHLNNK